MVTARWWAAAAMAVAACDDSATVFDGAPIRIERAGGALVASVRVDGAAPTLAVIDVMSPLTVVDAPLGAAPRRRGVTLTLLGFRAAADPTLIARGRVSTTALFQHPCDTEAACTVGAPGAPTPVGVVVGADALRDHGVRVTGARAQLTLFPDIAGSGADRDALCDAEVPSPFYGGGTLVVGGTEIGFDGLRPTLGVCLSPDPMAASAADRGVDAALVLSTGIGPSILSASRYEAWRVARGGPALAALPPATVLLPSGPIDGRLARIDRFAVVGAGSASSGACREVHAHQVLLERDCAAAGTADCPCTDETFCGVSSVVELGEFEALVVPDTEPLLQALRAELRPAQPEIDGVLGLSALDAVEFDLDYPHNRLLFRCADAPCVVRPALRERASRSVAAACIAGAPSAVDAGVDAP